MPVPAHWIEHRRHDGERLGWMVPEGDGFAVIDLLGRRMSASVDWLDAEELLDERGLGYLAEPFALLLDDGRSLRVRIVEVSPDRVRVKNEDWGAMDAPFVEHTLPFPAPPTLFPWAPPATPSPVE